MHGKDDPALEVARPPRVLPRFPWYLWAAFAVWAMLCIWRSGGGTAHVEIERYLPYHLSNDPLLKQLYNSRVLDQDMYQARELSYAIDAIDCHFIAWSVRVGTPHFLSISYFVLTLLIAFLLWRFLTSDLGLDRGAASLLLALYLTAPCVFFSTSYFRSAKVSLTLAEIILIVLLWRGLRTNNSRYGPWILFSLVAFAATLCDRQGFFLAAVMAGLLAWLYVWQRKRAAAVAAAAALTAVALSLAYNYLISPRITLALNGYWPNFSYQQLPWQNFREMSLTYVVAGLALLLDTVRFAFGDFPPVLVLPLLTGIALTIAKVHGRCWGAFAGVFLLALSAMNTLMTLRHPALVWDDVRRVYYWIPTTLLIVILVGIALAAVVRKENVVAMRVALAIALAANLLAIPQHQRIIAAGHMGERGPYSVALRRALVTGQPNAEIASDPIYRALKLR